jgi:hypothetical protein
VDVVITTWPEAEDPTERIAVHWFEELQIRRLELEFAEDDRDDAVN